jgi:hypothetical protein
MAFYRSHVAVEDKPLQIGSFLSGEREKVVLFDVAEQRDLVVCQVIEDVCLLTEARQSHTGRAVWD